MSLDKSLAFYKDRFADASDFTFVFVGSFDARDDQAARRTLPGEPSGALSTRRPAKDVGIRPPAGIVERQVVKGVEPKSEVGVVFTGPFPNDQMNRILMRAMAETLEGNLQRTLREDLGGTYGVSVRADFDKRPEGQYRLTIAFGCDPARMDALVTTLFRISISSRRPVRPTRRSPTPAQRSLAISRPTAATIATCSIS